MRMTNQIMQRNSLYNINQTKLLEDKYNTQLTSQSVITRPSDDPVVAIRALRLRSNVSTVTQYYKKNAPDANQWLDVTAESLNTITDVLTNLYKQVETGVNKDYTASDMEVLLTQISAYTSEMYATGNQDYAGRYIFTGYRTDTALTMTENDLEKEYNITENIGKASLDSFGYTDFSVFDTTISAENATEMDISNAEINRIRLSYKDLKEGENIGDIVIGNLDEKTATELKTKLDSMTAPKVNYSSDTDPKTNITTITIAASEVEAYADEEKAYQDMTALENGLTSDKDGNPIASSIMFIPSTGEILIKSDIAEALNDALTDGGQISTSYSKNKWSEENLNPEHYFYCVDDRGVEYNKDGDVDTQITYDVGYNQVIQVNTNANEVFNPGISRDYDDLSVLVQQYKEIEALRVKYQKELDSLEEGTAKYQESQKRYDAADKAYTYVRDAVSKRFGEQITRYQNYLDATNVAITKNGTRSTRLELISTRLSDQQSTFRELQENNEGIDMTEVAVKLTAAETTYDAALMATSKIMKQSLINYI